VRAGTGLETLAGVTSTRPSPTARRLPTSVKVLRSARSSADEPTMTVISPGSTTRCRSRPHEAPVSGRGLRLEPELRRPVGLVQCEEPHLAPHPAVRRRVEGEGTVEARHAKPHRTTFDHKGVRVVGHTAVDDGDHYGLAARRVLEAELGPVTVVDPDQEHARVERRTEVDRHTRAQLDVTLRRDAEERGGVQQRLRVQPGARSGVDEDVAVWRGLDRDGPRLGVELPRRARGCPQVEGDGGRVVSHEGSSRSCLLLATGDAGQ
jgi:hypothetical protein